MLGGVNNGYVFQEDDDFLVLNIKAL